jgi:CheY-like chemotaxis protein
MASAVPTVYVIDDEPDVLRALSRLLRSEGLQVRTFDDAFAFVRTGGRGFQRLRAARSVDAGAGRAGGAAAARREGLPHAGGVPERQRRRRASASAMQQGASAFLSKPVDAEVLLGAVRAAIERGRASSHDRRRCPATSLNWICALWSMIGGMSLALGLVYLLVGMPAQGATQHSAIRDRRHRRALWRLARAVDDGRRHTSRIQRGLRAAHLTFGVAMLLMPLFVSRALSRPASLVTGDAERAARFRDRRGAAECASHFAQVVMRPVLAAGRRGSLGPGGAANPWLLLAHLNLLLIAVFLVDVATEDAPARRSHGVPPRLADLLPASPRIPCSVGGWPRARRLGFVSLPFIVTPSFLLPILVLSYELGDEVLLSIRERDRSGRSESLLRESAQSWELAGMTAGIGSWSWDAASNKLALSGKAREMFELAD